ncbi:MAG TPA: MFS transporter [Solirubrobacteraceae bacterium]|nr:MFS transporter [Solirubrobacteraceae bacterium]
MLAISLAGTMSSGVVVPVLPLFVKDELGGGEQLVGLIVSLAPTFSLIAALLAGPYVDRAGRRVTAIAGLSVAVFGALLLIPADGVVLTALARSILGAGTGAAAAATITWAVDHVRPDRHGRALSVFGMTVWVGLSAGPQLGQAIYEAAGFSAVWATVAGLEAAGLLLAVIVSDPFRRPRADTARRGRLVPVGAGRPAVLIALAAYGEGVLTAFLVLHLIGRGVDAGAGLGGAASVYTIFAASVLACRVLAAGVMDRVRPHVIASAGFAAEAVGVALIAAATSFGLAAAGAALMGAGFAVLFPSLAVMATHAAADEERGAALASFGSAFGAGLTLGALLGGAIAAAWGTEAAHLSAAVAAAGAGLSLFAARGRGRRASLAVPEQAP